MTTVILEDVEVAYEGRRNWEKRNISSAQGGRSLSLARQLTLASGVYR